MPRAITTIAVRKSDLITVLSASEPPCFRTLNKIGEWNPLYPHYQQYHEQWRGFVFGIIVGSLQRWAVTHNDGERLTLVREDHYVSMRPKKKEKVQRFLGGTTCMADIQHLYETGRKPVS